MKEQYLRAQHVIAHAGNAVTKLAMLSEAFWINLTSILERRRGKIILTGIGKSGYIAMKVSATLTSLGHRALFVHPVEALHGDSGSVEEGDVVIAFSYSGTTKEVLFFVRHAIESFSVDVIAVTGNSHSELADLATSTVPITITAEGCPLDLAPMASTTAMLVFGDALVAALTSPEQFTKHDFLRFHPHGTLGLLLTPVEVRATMNSDFVVSGDTPLQETLLRMGEVGKGVVAVVSELGELVGSITDGDVRRFFTTATHTSLATAKDVMNSNPKCLHRGQNLKEALELMEHHKITNLFVIGEGRVPLGIIHIHDIVEV